MNKLTYLSKEKRKSKYFIEEIQNTIVFSVNQRFLGGAGFYEAHQNSDNFINFNMMKIHSDMYISEDEIYDVYITAAFSYIINLGGYSSNDYSISGENKQIKVIQPIYPYNFTQYTMHSDIYTPITAWDSFLTSSIVYVYFKNTTKSTVASTYTSLYSYFETLVGRGYIESKIKEFVNKYKFDLIGEDSKNDHFLVSNTLPDYPDQLKKYYLKTPAYKNFKNKKQGKILGQYATSYDNLYGKTINFIDFSLNPEWYGFNKFNNIDEILSVYSQIYSGLGYNSQLNFIDFRTSLYYDRFSELSFDFSYNPNNSIITNENIIIPSFCGRYFYNESNCAINDGFVMNRTSGENFPTTTVFNNNIQIIKGFNNVDIPVWVCYFIGCTPPNYVGYHINWEV